MTYRGLMVYSELPVGASLFMVPDADAEPHFHLGEFAVVAWAGEDLINGECYVIRWESGREALVQIRERPDNSLNAEPGATDWWVSSIRYPWSPPGGKVIHDAIDIAMRFGTVDGPYAPEHLARKIVGRVIGVFEALDESIQIVGGASGR